MALRKEDFRQQKNPRGPLRTPPVGRRRHHRRQCQRSPPPPPPLEPPTPTLVSRRTPPTGRTPPPPRKPKDTHTQREGGRTGSGRHPQPGSGRCPQIWPPHTKTAPGRAAGRSAGEEAAGRRVGEGTAGRRAGKEPQPPRRRKEPPPHQGKEPSCLLMCHRRTSPRCCSSPHVRGEPRGGDKWCNMCIWFFLFFKIPIVFFLGGKQQRKLINLSVPNTFLNLAI
jgi:hypothetical protein